MLIRKSETTWEIELKIRKASENLEKKEDFKNLEILEVDTINKQMQLKVRKEFHWRTRNLLQLKVFGKNLIKDINN